MSIRSLGTLAAIIPGAQAAFGDYNTPEIAKQVFSNVKVCAEKALTHLIQNDEAKWYFAAGLVAGLGIYMSCCYRTARVAGKTLVEPGPKSITGAPVLDASTSTFKFEIEEALQKGDFASVYLAIGKEKNLNDVLPLLRDEELQQYSQILYDRAVVEYKVTPTEETLWQISLPLMFEAAFRDSQDAECFEHSEKVQQIVVERHASYLQTLKDLIKDEDLSNEFDEIANDPEEHLLIVDAVLGRAMKSQNSASLPSPECFSSNPYDTIKLPDYVTKRDAYAQQTIKEYRGHKEGLLKK